MHAYVIVISSSISDSSISSSMSYRILSSLGGSACCWDGDRLVRYLALFPQKCGPTGSM